MKKIIGYISIAFLLVFVVCLNSRTTITTTSKQVYEGNNEEVTLRDLALLMALVYEDIPNATAFGTLDSSDDCFNNGVFTGSCVYGYDEKNWYIRDGFQVRRYIEGLSARKLNLFTAITTTTIEDGILYYFLNYANVSDAADWNISNYKSEKSLGNSNSAIMDAVTFKNGNNYVIAYRGTDFPDVLEWIQDLLYIKGEHAQADAAYRYAQSEYDRIVRENPNANIYVTGHSLGGYLAQVAGIAIVEKEEQLGVSNNSRLAQVAYFNGMGISGLGVDNGSIDKWIQDLEYLATHNRNGKKVTSNARVTNYKEPSSGRLVLYQMGGENAAQGDPVSEFGIHFGEVIRLEASRDSINYHNGTHQILVNGSWTEWFSTIPTNIENYIEEQINKIKNLSLKTVVDEIKSVFSKKDANTNFTEMISNTISIIANAAELTNENVSSVFKNKQLPDALKSRIQTALKTGGGILSLGSDIFSTGITSVVEKANIYHETDSFLCLLDEDSGIPNVTIVGANESQTNKVIYSKTTTKEDPNATSQVYYNGDPVDLAVVVNEGCARKYEIYETTNGTHDLISTNSPNISIGNYTEGTAKTRTFEIRVYYGNKLRTMVLENNEYVTYGDVKGDYNQYVTHNLEVIYNEFNVDCIRITTQTDLKVTLSSKKDTISKNLIFICTTDGAGFTSNLSDKSVSYFDNNVSGFGRTIDTTVSKIKAEIVSGSNSKKLRITVPLQIKFVDKAVKTPGITFRATFTDKLGNKAAASMGNLITMNYSF